MNVHKFRVKKSSLEKKLFKKSCWNLKGEIQTPKCKTQNLTYTVYFQRCLNLTGQNILPNIKFRLNIWEPRKRKQLCGRAGQQTMVILFFFYLLLCSKSSLPILKAFVSLFFFLIWLRSLFTLSANTHHLPSSSSYVWLYITGLIKLLSVCVIEAWSVLDAVFWCFPFLTL